jgi:hypothetical protein
MKVFSFDTVFAEVMEWSLGDPPENMTDEALLVWANSQISLQTDDEAPALKKVRNEHGVLVLDAEFGRGQVSRVFVHQEDPEKAKNCAKRELKTLLDE